MIEDADASTCVSASASADTHVDTLLNAFRSEYWYLIPYVGNAKLAKTAINGWLVCCWLVCCYVLVTSKVILGWVSTCDSAHS